MGTQGALSADAAARFMRLPPRIVCRDAPRPAIRDGAHLGKR